jgi:hypothetical protein
VCVCFYFQTMCAIGNCFSLQKEHDVAIKFFKRAIQVSSPLEKGILGKCLMHFKSYLDRLSSDKSKALVNRTNMLNNFASWVPLLCKQ